MKSLRKLWPLGCLLLVSIAPAAFAQTVTFFQPFENALHSCTIGITPSGDIAGWYDELISVGPPVVTKRHGFLLRGGVMTSFDPPGSVGNLTVGINSRGNVTGYWWDGSSPAIYKGFLLRDGQFTNLEYPGAVDTMATGLNEEGDIVGYYRNLLNPGPPRVVSRFFGFLRTRHGEYRTLEPPIPDLTGVRLWGINPRGDVVGEYSRPDGYDRHPFLLTKGGQLTTFEPPDMARPPGWGRAIGINPQGDVSGDYVAEVGPTTTKTLNFLWKNGILETYDLEGVTGNGARGITPSGWLVGCANRVNPTPPPAQRTWSWIRSPR